MEERVIDVKTLSNWLNEHRDVSILDIRPKEEREQWFIPFSIHFDAYEKLKAKKANALEGLLLNKEIPVVTICAGGKTSLTAAELLREQGYEAYSLKDGMKGWSLSWNTGRISFDNYDIIQFRRTGKGCLSYIITSKQEAIIIDASLSIDAYQGFIDEYDLKVVQVLETHIHADHLSRSKQLAEWFSVPLNLPVPNKVNFDFRPIHNGTMIQIGNIYIEAISTPGHTIESTSYLVDKKVLLSGDTLFVNGVGRPDLKADRNEAIHKSELLYNSLCKLLALDAETLVLPAHTSEPIMFDGKPIQTTIGKVRNDNPLLHLDKDQFITTILERIPDAPPNYLDIVDRNIKGDFSDVNPVDLEVGANKCTIS